VLGSYCAMQYPSTCEGTLAFYVVADDRIDWGAPIITGARYRVEDRATACLPIIANCNDEYTVQLERLSP
jgi:hypothetical protein